MTHPERAEDTAEELIRVYTALPPEKKELFWEKKAVEYLKRITASEKRAETLFDAIAHGDDEHRAWLKSAISAHFAGEPIPPVQGLGRKEAALAIAEKRASEAERTFADLRNLIAVNLAANAELMRERDEARSRAMFGREVRKLQSERDEARAALGKVVEDAAAICTGWLDAFAGEIITYVSPADYAADAVRDIRDQITALTHTGNDG